MDDQERIGRWLHRWSETDGLVKAFGMTFALGEEGYETHMTVGSDLGGGPGVAHGGVAMALLDTGIGVAVLSKSLPRGRAASTIELKTNLLMPIHLGETLVCRARCLRIGRTHVTASGEIYDSLGQAMAVGLGTFNLYESEAIALLFNG